MSQPQDNQQRDSTMLDAALDYAALGYSVHWLHPRQKRPIGNDWNARPVQTADDLRATSGRPRPIVPPRAGYRLQGVRTLQHL